MSNNHNGIQPKETGNEYMNVTLLELSPGKWRLRIETARDPATGKRMFRYERVNGLREDAEMRRLELLRTFRAGENHMPRQRAPKGSANLTLGAYLTRWIKLREHRGEISASTAEWYSSMMKYVLPKLGETPLRDVTPEELQALYDDLLNRVSPRTVRHVHTRLATAFDDAMIEGLVESNPLAGKRVRPPKAAENKTETLTQQEAIRLQDYAREHGPTLLPLVRFALATGLRRGELCALRWQDVEFIRDDNGKLVRALVHVKSNAVQIGSSVIIKRPKTQSGTRTLAVSGQIVDELAAVKEAVSAGLDPQERLKVDAFFVFPPGSNAMGHRSPSALTQQVNKLLENAGLGRFTLHDLRHAHATFLLRNRMPVKAVSERLGHADITITLRTYAHVIPQDDEALAHLAGGLISSTGLDDDETSHGGDEPQDDEE